MVLCHERAALAPIRFRLVSVPSLIVPADFLYAHRALAYSGRGEKRDGKGLPSQHMNPDYHQISQSVNAKSG